MEEKTTSAQLSEPLIEPIKVGESEGETLTKYLMEGYTTSKVNSHKLDVLMAEIKDMRRDIKFLKKISDNLGDRCSDLDEKIDSEMEYIQEVLCTAQDLIKDLSKKD